MDKKMTIFLFIISLLCVFVFIFIAVLKNGDNKVQNTTENSRSSEKETILSELEQKLIDARTSDDSLPDMSEDEISSAIDLLHEKGMDYKNITAQDLRHSNDIIPEIRTYSEEEVERMTDLERAKAGWLTTIGDEPKNSLVFWILPERIENGYNISIATDNELIEPRYLYDWEYAKANYAYDFEYLLRDEEQLKRSTGRAYSELFADLNTYTSYHGLDANEYLSPGEDGRFVLLRWFKFKDSEKEGWAVCYVDVVNDSDTKRTKRDCPMTQVLFNI